MSASSSTSGLSASVSSSSASEADTDSASLSEFFEDILKLLRLETEFLADVAGLDIQTVLAVLFSFVAPSDSDPGPVLKEWLSRKDTQDLPFSTSSFCQDVRKAALPEVKGASASVRPGAVSKLIKTGTFAFSEAFNSLFKAATGANVALTVQHAFAVVNKLLLVKSFSTSTDAEKSASIAQLVVRNNMSVVELSICDDVITPSQLRGNTDVVDASRKLLITFLAAATGDVAEMYIAKFSKVQVQSGEHLSTPTDTPSKQREAVSAPVRAAAVPTRQAGAGNGGLSSSGSSVPSSSSTLSRLHVEEPAGTSFKSLSREVDDASIPFTPPLSNRSSLPISDRYQGEGGHAGQGDDSDDTEDPRRGTASSSSSSSSARAPRDTYGFDRYSRNSRPSDRRRTQGYSDLADKRVLVKIHERHPVLSMLSDLPETQKFDNILCCLETYQDMLSSDSIGDWDGDSALFRIRTFASLRDPQNKFGSSAVMTSRHFIASDLLASQSPQRQPPGPAQSDSATKALRSKSTAVARVPKVTVSNSFMPVEVIGADDLERLISGGTFIVPTLDGYLLCGEEVQTAATGLHLRNGRSFYLQDVNRKSTPTLSLLPSDAQLSHFTGAFSRGSVKLAVDKLSECIRLLKAADGDGADEDDCLDITSTTLKCSYHELALTLFLAKNLQLLQPIFDDFFFRRVVEARSLSDAAKSQVMTKVFLLWYNVACGALMSTIHDNQSLPDSAGAYGVPLAAAWWPTIINNPSILEAMWRQLQQDVAFTEGLQRLASVVWVTDDGKQGDQASQTSHDAKTLERLENMVKTLSNQVQQLQACQAETPKCRSAGFGAIF